MCLSCGEHVWQNLWYLDPEKHTLDHAWWQEPFERRIYSGIVAGLKMVAKKQPYGVTDRWTGVNRALWNWFSRTLRGFQVLPDLDSAIKVVDLANELALTRCSCRMYLAPEQPVAWKCIGLNYSAHVVTTHQTVPFQPISKDEAKELIAGERKQGSFVTVGWGYNGKVSWICNCDQFCGAHRTVECPWAMIPSFFVSRLLKPEACDGCPICAEWCTRPGAIVFGADGRPIIQEALCRGCGQCIEHCPKHALGFVPREVYYDVPTRSVKRLPQEALAVSL